MSTLERGIRLVLVIVSLLVPAGLPARAQSGAPAPDWTVQGPNFGTDPSRWTHSAGDLNGDGYSDVVVGYPVWQATAPGRADIFAGSRTGLSSSPTWTLGGPSTAGLLFGYSVAGAGDVNGDGFDDLLVGAPRWGGGIGVVSLFYGSALGPGPAPAWSIASDGAGTLVEPAGDVNRDGFADFLVTFGSFWEGGMVALYLGGPGGPGSISAWSASGERPGDGFGTALAAGDVDGDGYDDVVIGAPNVEPFSLGRAYLYRGTAAGLEAAPAWVADSVLTGGSFALSLAVGDVNGDGYGDVVVGDYGTGLILWNEGQVYVYFGGAAGPATTPEVTLQANRLDGLTAKAFGFSVASGDIDRDGDDEILVGAAFYADVNGAVFLFRGGPGGPEPEAVWIAEGDEPGASFGWSARFAGDVDGNGSADALVTNVYGRVALFALTARSSSDADGDLRLDGSDNCPKTANREQIDSDGDRVGDACDVCSSVPDILQDDYDDDGIGNVCDNCPEGFHPNPLQEDGDSDGIGDVCDLCPAVADPLQQDANGNWIGDACEEDDDADGVVDPGDNCSTDFNPGQEDADSDGVGDACEGRRLARQNLPGPQQGSAFGGAIASAGDVNGDGFDDLLVGAPNYSGRLYSAGRVDLYLGGTEGAAAPSAWSAEGETISAGLGQALAGVGDVNGDGFDDVVVGAPYDDNENHGPGHAYLYLGGVAGLGQTPAWIGAGEGPFAGFGAAIAGAGDVNQDGFDDVLIGSPGYFRGIERYGRAYLFHGGIHGLQPDPAWISDGDSESNSFGAAIASAGDVNGDGYRDVLIGGLACCDPGGTGRNNGRGRAYLFLGSASGPATSPAWIVEGDSDYDYLGYAVAGIGDVNGDGLDDVLVSTPYAFTTAPGGLANLYLGTSDGLTAAPVWTVTGTHLPSNLGAAIGAAGDVNRDGYADFFIGDQVVTSVPNADITHGRVRVYAGSPSGPTGPVLTVLDRQAFSGFGFAVSAGLDLRGDGTPDLAVGAWGYDIGRPDLGAVFLYDLGSDADSDGVPDVTDNCPGTFNDDQDPCACTQCGLSDASVTFVTSELSRGGVTVDWATINEFTVRGFNIVEISPSGQRTQKNLALIPCDECVTGLGSRYLYILSKRRGSNSLYIEMVLADGTLRRFGPIPRK